MKTALLLCLLTTSLFAQVQTAKTPKVEPVTCTMSVEQSPTIRGIKLGMAEADAKKWLGDRSMPFYYSVDFDGRSEFKGVQTIHLDYYAEKIRIFEIRYDPDVHWYGPTDFAVSLSKSLGLPWQAWGFRKGKGFMQCPEFDVIADPSNHSITLVDTVATAQMDAAARKAAAEVKQVFKP